ncbi:formylmethanofuran dehydrogenase subunit C [Nitrosococcus wardiae]|uniref:Formylmethanofuran dehydrogenase subunit C n=1 Tax=Nitrosococcus wardiae TaxID=1814290 RepID=A0A4P7BXB3_9GAMM|nr:formylmethanofuran dehydrogenase subunit C [Nitrosococcus wardiae]QBQ53774.1 formylmethanofuran dehydrogenase subunit C [Nitrosococcus wardiae]
MNMLTLTLKTTPPQGVDVSPLTPENLADLSKAEIGSIALMTGNRRLRVDELFEISGDNTKHLVFTGETALLDYLGKNLSGGQIEVQGPCGAYVGMGMNTGQIHVRGNSGAFAGCEMGGGLLRIEGNSGDFLGAARPGNKIGMWGGTIIVTGNVGARAGDHMRRGTLLIEGNAGDYLGSRMLAGTIAVLGKTGIYPGYGMKRGTLLLWQAPSKLSTTFNDCGYHTLGFLPLMLKSYQSLETRFTNLTKTDRVHRFCGDMATLGHGEILIQIQETA